MHPRDHPAVTAVLDALTAAGHVRSADGMVLLDDAVRTAAQAAAALGVAVGAIANSLVFDAGDKPLLALTSGAHRASLARLTECAGGVPVRRADPDFVRRHTGQAIGGVAPTGHPMTLFTLVDAALANYPVVWAAGGHPKAVFPTTFADLLALTDGSAADLGTDPDGAG